MRPDTVRPRRYTRAVDHDHDHVDVAERALRQSLEQRHARGTRLVKNGVVLLGLIPVVILVAIALSDKLTGTLEEIVLMSALLYPFVGGGAGIGLIAIGASGRAMATRRLRGLDARRQLPQARLVER